MSIYNGIIIEDLTDKGFGEKSHHIRNGEYLNIEDNVGVKNTVLQAEKLEIVTGVLIRKQRIHKGFHPSEEIKSQITVTTDAPRNFPLEVSWIKK